MSSNAYASHIGWAQETAWGTAVPPTKFAELLSEDIKGAHPRIPSGSVRNVTERRHFAGVKSAAGSFTVEMMYEGFLRLLEYLMGNGSSALEGASLAYRHTFTFQEALNTGLTIEVERDAVSERYEGCLIDGATFTFQPDLPLQTAFNIIGQQSAEAGPGTFSAPPEKLVLHHQMAAEIDDSSIVLLGAELTIAQNLQADKKGLGVPDILKPVRSGKREVTGTITVDLDDNAHLTKYLAGTEFKLELLHTGSLIETSHYEEFNFVLTRCVFTDHPANVGGPGPVVVALPFKAFYDISGTKDALEINVKNSETAIA